MLAALREKGEMQYFMEWLPELLRPLFEAPAIRIINALYGLINLKKRKNFIKPIKQIFIRAKERQEGKVMVIPDGKGGTKTIRVMN